MGVQRRRTLWRAGGIGDQRGATRINPGKAHAFRVSSLSFAADLRECVIQSPIKPAPAAMESRKTAVRMPQRAQRWPNAFDRRSNRSWDKLSAAFNRGLRPK